MDGGSWEMKRDEYTNSSSSVSSSSTEEKNIYEMNKDKSVKKIGAKLSTNENSLYKKSNHLDFLMNNDKSMSYSVH